MVLDPTDSFARQLRAGTNDLHAGVEAVSDLPGSVHTVEDYAELLSTFYAAHAVAEGALGSAALAPGWDDLDIDLARHSQLGALTEDLTALGTRPQRPASTSLVLDSPAEALGCLYVIEGSAFGRRVLAPLLKQKLGVVPSAFFDGRTDQPRAWREVQRALQSAAGDARRQQAVISGARAAFGVFLDVFDRRDAHRRLSRR